MPSYNLIGPARYLLAAATSNWRRDEANEEKKYKKITQFSDLPLTLVHAVD